MICSLFLIIYL